MVAWYWLIFAWGVGTFFGMLTTTMCVIAKNPEDRTTDQEYSHSPSVSATADK